MAALPFLYQLQNASFGSLAAQAFEAAVVDMDESGLTQSNIQALHDQGKILFTYLSIGEAEDYRDYWIDGNWNSNKPSFVLGENPDWEGNFSVKFWDPAWQALMFARVDDAIAHGYDGMYLDIVDAYEVDQVQDAYTGPNIRQAMIDFVVALSKHAKALDPDFQVIPQNAVGLLALNESNPSVPNTAYLNAIDGIGVEDLWYDGNSSSSWTSGDLEFLQNAIHANKFVLATSYPTDPAKQEDFVNKAIAAGFVPFVADRDLTGKIAAIDLTIEGRLVGHDIDTPWDDASNPTSPVPNTPPVAVADSYAVKQNVALSINAASGVLANDTDANGNTLKALTVAGPSHGSLVLKNDGSFVYTPAQGFVGLDSFTYKANDGSADSGVVTVKLNVAATPPTPNTAPTAVADTYNLKQNAALSVSAALGVLANDSDANGDSLKAITVAGPAHGSVVLKNDGSFVYTPVQGFTGLDSFTYKANDGAADSGVVAVKLNVAPIVVAPPADPLAGDNTIVGTSRADILEGRGGNDTISGLGGSDYLNGGIGNDKLNAGIGNDKLSGDSGDDVLIAGDGNDVITGGIGKDFITSGLGADHMFFVSLEEMGTSSSSRDVITDFDPRFDRIDLFNIDADTSLSGNQAFSLLLTAGADFTKAGQLHFEYTTVSGVEHTIIEGNVNRRLGADFQIDLVGHIKVAADDFML